MPPEVCDNAAPKSSLSSCRRENRISWRLSVLRRRKPGLEDNSVTIIRRRNELSEFRTALSLQVPLMTALSWLVTTIAPHRSCRRLQHVAWPWSSSRNPVLRPGSIASASILKRGDIWPPGIFLALVTDELLILMQALRQTHGPRPDRRISPCFVGRGRSAF